MTDEIEDKETILIPAGYTAHVKKNSTRTGFQMVDKLTSKTLPEWKRVKKDFLDKLLESSKPARDLFLLIKNNMYFDSNMSVVPKAENQVELNKRSAGYKELKDLDIIIRVKPNLYMVNPSIIIPSKEDNFESATKWWIEFNKTN